MARADPGPPSSARLAPICPKLCEATGSELRVFPRDHRDILHWIERARKRADEEMPPLRELYAGRTREEAADDVRASVCHLVLGMSGASLAGGHRGRDATAERSGWPEPAIRIGVPDGIRTVVARTLVFGIQGVAEAA